MMPIGAPLKFSDASDSISFLLVAACMRQIVRVALTKQAHACLQIICRSNESGQVQPCAFTM